MTDNEKIIDVTNEQHWLMGHFRKEPNAVYSFKYLVDKYIQSTGLGTSDRAISHALDYLMKINFIETLDQYYKLRSLPLF